MPHARRATAAFAAVVAVFVAAVLAGDASAARRQPFSLTVSPARLVVHPSPGRKTLRLRVADTGTRPLHVDVSVAEFGQAPNGDVTFHSGGPLSATSWVRVRPRAVDLRPGDQRYVRVKVTVPAHPEPGERQLGILFRVPPKRTGRNIAISGAIGSELLVGVPGRVTRGIRIGPLTVPTIHDGGPIRVGLHVRNLGNVHRDYIRPHRLVATTDTGIRLPFPDLTVLRQSTRNVETSWNDPPLACICHVTVRTNAGHGHAITASARVIVFPIRLALGTIIAALGIAILLRQLQRRHRQSLTRAREEGYRDAQLQSVTQPDDQGE